MPTENVPKPITLIDRREQAAAEVAELTGLSPLTASLVVDIIDVATAAVLRLTGLTNLEVRRVAAIIWGEP